MKPIRVLQKLAALILTLCLSTAFIPVTALAMQTPPADSGVMIYDASDNLIDLGKDTADTVVLIFGYFTCGYTIEELTEANRLLQEGKNFKCYYLNVVNEGAPDLSSRFPNITCIDNVSRNWPEAVRLFMDLHPGATGGSLTTPFTVILGKNRMVRHYKSGGDIEDFKTTLDRAIADPGPEGLPAMPKNPVAPDNSSSSGDTVNLTIRGTFHQSEARKALPLINELRRPENAWVWNMSDTEKEYNTNLIPLSYDYNLEKSAMRRAAEIAFSFEHTRPDGDRHASSLLSSYSVSGENIGFIISWDSSVENSVDAFAEADEKYSGQGHRRAMLSASYSHVGVACFEYGNRTYWVQHFGYGRERSKATRAFDGPAEVDVKVLKDIITSLSAEFTSSESRFPSGSSSYLPGVMTTIKTRTPEDGRESTQHPVDGAEITYRVSDDSIARIDGNRITGLKEGKTTLTCDVTIGSKTTSLTREIEVFSPLTVSSLPFADVPGNSYYAPSVAWALNNGITGGTSADSFSPDMICTRSQVMTFLWKALGAPNPGSVTSAFNDVKDTASWFYRPVLWATGKGVTSGTGDGNFGVGAPCTRAQVMTFLWKAMGEPTPSSLNSSFSDVTDPNAYYYRPVMWAVSKGITSGTGDGAFGIDAPCTRAQVMTFLYKLSH